MKRDAIKLMYEWKKRTSRKPLLLRGARQVGKTWLMRHFASEAFPDYIYINFESDKTARKFFDENLDITRISFLIETHTGKKLNAQTLLILDEIQNAPQALTSLKYFCENAPHLYIMAAGSLLGVHTNAEASFPVGKVEFLDIYPMSFKEFIEARGETNLSELITKGDFNLIDIFKSQLTDLLKHYLFCGGMPEVVKNFIDTGSLIESRRIQVQILSSYYADFGKHVKGNDVEKVRMVWNSLIGQLSKENSKFIYGALKSGARAREFENAIQWLIDAGMIYKINRISKAEIPLSAYSDVSAFKLYCLDVGLLGAMGDLQPNIITEGNSLFMQFKGILTEQYVLQQLISEGIKSIFYWSSEKSDGEIDFIIQHHGKIIPIEVKAEKNVKAKSLRLFVERHTGMHGLRFSMQGYEKQSWVTNIPLYCLPSII